MNINNTNDSYTEVTSGKWKSNIKHALRNAIRFLKKTNESIRSYDFMFFEPINSYIVHRLVANIRRGVAQGKIQLKAEDWLLKRNRAYRRPSAESEAIKYIEQAYPDIEKYNLSKMKNVTYDEVVLRDTEQMHAYCRYKTINFQELDLNIMDEVFNYVGQEEFVPYKQFKPLGIEQAFDSMESSTSSCYPEFKKKGDPQVRNKIRGQINELIYQSKEGEKYQMFLKFINLFTVIFHRFTPTLKRKANKDEVEKITKVRQVYGIPFFVGMLETMMHKPAVEHVCKTCPYFSYGLTRVNISEQVTLIREEAYAQGKKVLCGDFSKVDSTIPPEIHIILLNFLSSFMKYKDWHWNIVEQLLMYHLITPIAWSGNSISYTFGGNKSGSLYTSLTNGLSLFLGLDYFIFKKYGRHVKRNELFILGDDFIMVIDEEDKEEIISIMSRFNLKLHGAKSAVVEPDEDITYLGFRWNIKGYPTNDLLWWVAKICFPERYVEVSGIGRIISRAASILFQINNGSLIFDKVFGCVRKVKKAIRNTNNVIVTYYDNVGRPFYINIPLTSLYTLGWKAF